MSNFVELWNKKSKRTNLDEPRTGGRLKSATHAQLGERFQETGAPHGMFSEAAAEISLMFILSASAEGVLISPNTPYTHMDPLE